jgi:methyl-accepting chemotaxis protein
MKFSWDKIFWWGMILFSLFVLYQLIRNILGVSWELEAILVAVVMGNLGVSVTNLREIHTLKREFKHYKVSHQSLAKDFKEFRKETNDNFAKIDQNFSRLSHLMK